MITSVDLPKGQTFWGIGMLGQGGHGVKHVPRNFSIIDFFGVLMKLKKIAVAGIMLAAGASFAQSVVCNKTTPANFVNTCKPGVTFFVAGSSALGGAISSVLNANVVSGVKGYFDTTSVPLVTVIDTGTPNGVSVLNDTNVVAGTKMAGNGVSAWYGMSRAELTGGVSVPLLVVYNSYMGSAAGVSNVMAKDITKVPEADVVTVGPVAGAANTCTVVTAPITIAGTTSTVATATNKVACSSHAFTRADIAISDVDASELLALYPTAKEGVAISKLVRKPLAMQGFAVAVNNNFYNALQAYQITTGALPTTCTTGLYTEACQHSISRVQYASLVTKEGKIKSAAGFIPNDTTALTLARRDELSGTQATSNIYFASEVCNALDAKSKINTHGGALTALKASDAAAFAPGLVVNENVQTGGVETDLKATTGYSIGVIALSKGNSTSYKFVKLDGKSPNFAKAGTTLLSGGNLRNNMINGSWDLQMTAYAIYNSANSTYNAKKGILNTYLINQMVADLSDSSLHDLSAIGYFNGTEGVKKTSYMKVASVSSGAKPVINNCAPLIAYTE